MRLQQTFVLSEEFSPVVGTELSAAARQYGVLPMPSLEWNEQVGRETAPSTPRVAKGHPAGRMAVLRALRKAINASRGATQSFLAQLSDARDLQLRCRFVGDSLQLAREATRRRRRHRAVRRAFHGGDIRSSIRQDRTDPDSKAGCSLASSITGADVRLLRQRYPGVPVVAYVNTSADVKAEVDICCTSERR